MLRAVAAVLLAGLAKAAVADPSMPTPTHADDPSKAGRLDRVLAPEYPKEALAKGITGSVDIEGVVTGWRTLSEVQFRPVTPESAVFVDALKAAVPYWRFFAWLGDDCMPSNVHVGTRAIFEIQDGKAKISIEHAALEKPGATPVRLNPIRRVQPKYPERLLRAEIDAFVYALIKVSVSGEVLGVATQTFPRYKGLALPQDHRNYREVAIAFDKDVSDAVRRWEYPPAPPGDNNLRANCVTFMYRIRD